jgi:hypothetical protein
LILAFLVKRFIFGRLHAGDDQSALVPSGRRPALPSSQATANAAQFIKP